MRSLDLSRVDVEDLLNQYDIDHEGPSATGEIAICCPFHLERNPSCHINVDNALFRCKACGEKGSVVHFIAKLENVSLQFAEYLLKQRYDSNFREPIGDLLTEFERSIAEKEVEDSQPKILPEHLTEKFWPMSNEGFRYLWERGVSNETIQELSLGWDASDRRVTFPIRDQHRNLLGFKGRAIDPWVKAKYKVLGDSANWTKYRFPMYDTKKAVYLAERLPQNEVVVCEGELNAAAMVQMGYEAVAIGGSSPSKDHALALRRLAHRVVLFLDTDEAGLRATREFNAMLEPFMDVLVAPDHSGDAADALIKKNGMTVEMVGELIEQAQPLYLIELDY